MQLQKLNYCNDTLALKNSIEIDFLELGKRLKNIRDNRLFESQWESFSEYVLEFKNLSEGTVSKLINIYEKFVVEYGFAPEQIAEAGGWTVLAETLPVVKTAKQAEHWLLQATALTRSDLRRSISEQKTGIEIENCTHPRKYTLCICPDCALREKVA